jgi:hypothetical protein
MAKLPTTKEEFHRYYARVLRRIGKQIPGHVEVHSNKAGPAALGEVYLNAEGLHVCVGGTFWDSLGQPGATQFYYRWEDRDAQAKQRKDRHTAMGVNRWLTVLALTQAPDRCVRAFLAAREEKR